MGHTIVLSIHEDFITIGDETFVLTDFIDISGVDREDLIRTAEAVTDVRDSELEAWQDEMDAAYEAYLLTNF